MTALREADAVWNRIGQRYASKPFTHGEQDNPQGGKDTFAVFLNKIEHFLQVVKPSFILLGGAVLRANGGNAQRIVEIRLL